MVVLTHDDHVRVGYKLTDVGVIPEDWDVKQVRRISKVVRGASPRPAGDPRYFNGDYIPWLTVAALTTVPDYQVRIHETFGYLTEAGASYSRRLEEGTLIIANSGATLGVAKILAVSCCANDGIAALLDQRTCDNLFLCYYLNSQTDRLRKVIATGNGQPNLNTALIGSLSVPIPPLREQLAIASALADVDSLLASMDQHIAKKRGIKQAAMQQLLTGEMRLPGFNGKWQEKTFGDVMTGFASGATPSRSHPEYFQGDIRWITSGELNYNTIVDTAEKISEEAVSKSNLKLLPPGTFLIAITGLEAEGTRGSCGIVGAEATTNQSCMALFPTRELSNSFLFHFYVYKGNALALQYCQGTKQQSYTGKIVKLLPILLPPIKEQEAIVAVLSDMDAEIAALERQLDKMQALKQGMVQELLTGRRRLV